MLKNYCKNTTLFPKYRQSQTSGYKKKSSVNKKLTFSKWCSTKLFSSPYASSYTGLQQKLISFIQRRQCQSRRLQINLLQSTKSWYFQLVFPRILKLKCPCFMFRRLQQKVHQFFRVWSATFHQTKSISGCPWTAEIYFKSFEQITSIIILKNSSTNKCQHLHN